MKRLILALVMAAVFLLSSVTVVSAATEEEINNSIMMGLEWLTNNQEAGGSWPDYYGSEATTGLALLKLCEYAKEQGFDPYDPDYIYSSNVTAGLDYLYSRMSVIDLSLQDHTAGASGMMDDPDSNGNGVGIYVSGYNSYTTGIGLSALSVCGLPERVVDAPNTLVHNMTQAQIAQDMVDWLAFAQSDYHYDYTGVNDCGEGGWYYWALDNSNNIPDNSNTGYAILGLAYADDFGSTVPQWVKTELNAYVECIQDPVNGDANDGGSWYRNIGDTDLFIGTNILKTGNLIFEMAFVGDA
ncbi:MAG: hypothetical protein KAJ20_02000, partial [Candidatus Aenigmarchaeota archaeon]|nr:hypothetical protein [Candidatus Aenigmarchaeota archaeon]